MKMNLVAFISIVLALVICGCMSHVKVSNFVAFLNESFVFET